MTCRHLWSHEFGTFIPWWRGCSLSLRNKPTVSLASITVDRWPDSLMKIAFTPISSNIKAMFSRPKKKIYLIGFYNSESNGPYLIASIWPVSIGQQENKFKVCVTVSVVKSSDSQDRRDHWFMNRRRSLTGNRYRCLSRHRRRHRRRHCL